jgi:hypothetical protein
MRAGSGAKHAASGTMHRLAIFALVASSACAPGSRDLRGRCTRDCTGQTLVETVNLLVDVAVAESAEPLGPLCVPDSPDPVHTCPDLAGPDSP